ncbi:hypothetical protein M406DRAFT_352239 [Cryphonectria parasitica EP155]|uniref:Uncharacterized protein n=1 Tax=Cryphonectria parasitica (strain ATCC 38755 / EP155) TaxID=660469 RepID=A0A9P5CMS7_CRYP1|nr:uncharacterized protein M406DRAFT_352239 [Cryphonectria parasitica EP155]KAF3763190.1 hypothetical protein M406DRAFT_352239 [Cryphonectria parasitica EP155]
MSKLRRASRPPRQRRHDRLTPGKPFEEAETHKRPLGYGSAQVPVNHPRDRIHSRIHNLIAVDVWPFSGPKIKNQSFSPNISSRFAETNQVYTENAASSTDGEHPNGLSDRAVHSVLPQFLPTPSRDKYLLSFGPIGIFQRCLQHVSRFWR